MRNHTRMLAGSAMLAAAIAATPAVAEDTRELVKLPEMMQEHMLANMRDHVATLDAILDALANGDNDKASSLAESRLGMSSLSLHGAEHLAKFMPEGMNAIGTRMHRAASRFAIAVKDAELKSGAEAQREVYRALQGITENCNACHQGYRVR